ncbi:MAG TPA: carboxyl transferase domain-containing protein [Myxococcales bacterium]|nr:carboxyl transferase domain-containing protein [Myxococcales bacterium]
MQRTAVLDEFGTGRRAARALRARGVEVITLAHPGDAASEGKRIELPSFAPDAVVAAARSERADSVWLMTPSPETRQAIASRCAAQGIAVMGPDPDQLALAAAALRPVPAGARRMEAFVAADASGTVRTLAVVEKLSPGLVETPLSLPAQARDLAAATAESACRGTQWRGVAVVQLAGTAEGVAVTGFDAAGAGEAAVEDLTGLDLIVLRAALEAGEPVPEVAPAIACAVSASISGGSAAREGKVTLVRVPRGPGVRISSCVWEGDRLPAAEVPLATICATGRDRGEALRRLRDALGDCAIVVEGRTVNRGALLAACAAALAPDAAGPAQDPAFARAAAAIFEYEAAVRRELDRFLAQARRGRPRIDPPEGRLVELIDADGRHRLRVAQIVATEFRVDARVLHVQERGPYERRIASEGRTRTVLHSEASGVHHLEIDGLPYTLQRAERGAVFSPMPAVVEQVLVQPGDHVAAGQQIAVLEAMKLETAIVAPQPGRVREVLVAANQHVAAGAPLLTLAPEDEPPDELHTAVEPVACGVREPARELHRLLLGFDDDGWDARALASGLARAQSSAELDVLRSFAELAALFSRARTAEMPPPFELLLRYLAMPDARGTGLPGEFLALLDHALAGQGVSRTAAPWTLNRALLRLWKARRRMEDLLAPTQALLEKRLGTPLPAEPAWRPLLETLISVARPTFPAIADLARELRFRWFDRPLFQQVRGEVLSRSEADLRRLASAPDADAVRRVVEVTWPLSPVLIDAMAAAAGEGRARLVEVLLRRYYRIRELEAVGTFDAGNLSGARAEYTHNGRRIRLLVCFAPAADAAAACRQLARAALDAPRDLEIALELYLSETRPTTADELAKEFHAALEAAGADRPVRRAAFVVAAKDRRECFTFRPGENGYVEERHLRGVHPMLSKRLQLDRLSQFELTRLPASEDVYLYHGRARGNARDERFFALGEVRDLTPLRNASGRIVNLPQLEHVLHGTCAALRLAQARRGASERLEWNRVLLGVSPPFALPREEALDIARRLEPETEGLGLEMVVLSVQVPQPDGSLQGGVIRIFNPDRNGVRVRWDGPAQRPLLPLGEYQQRVVQLRRRGVPYAYEIVKLLTPSATDASQADMPPGDFVEHDLDESGVLVPVDRPPGKNTAHIVCGVVRNITAKYPEGMRRVILLGDASREMGSVAEPECRRVMAALDLAEKLRVPVEWFALSAGAQISLESGSENMDWVSRALRRIIEFTQAGGEINVVVAGINVGAQPYWNAEATMLMHTRGILIMTPASAMVLTGKQALEYSGGVSAEDNQGIGGYDRIMGPNGQAQYWAPDLGAACGLLLRHYDHTWVQPGERFPRPGRTTDPRDRDVCASPHPAAVGGFTTVGEIFSAEKNPERKKPFEIRAVMGAVLDQDHAPLERWRDLRGGDTGVIWDAHLGGYPVCVIGVQSHAVPRLGFIPGDGPDAWSGGTLFPQSSRKIARAINSASGNRPLVVLANLSGFDGSPESMRRLQLEYGAEIGRAVVNFKGPVVFCVVSRYHGGAFVVFSRTLRENMEVMAVEGARASVIGGAPAAAVVFAREVEQRTRKDPRFASASGDALAHLRAEKMGEVAEEYDRVHDIRRAMRVGSVERILDPHALRRELIEAVERGMAREGK